jgi:Protein of unknown function (DUF3738)
MSLVITAYEVRSQRVSGPDWMASQKFDILATMPEGATEKQVPEMLLSLLVETGGLSGPMNGPNGPMKLSLTGATLHYEFARITPKGWRTWRPQYSGGPC